LDYIILIAVGASEHKEVAYFVCFLLTASVFVSSFVFHGWYMNNIIDKSQQKATVGFLVSAANCAGIPYSLAF
jgi:hypothetical protein